MLFEIGRQYHRGRDIHDRYGGNRRSGIVSSQSAPLIFIFSGSTGARYGYDDRYTDDGVLHYTGEGQVGDMRMIRGNRAIRNHIADGRDLHLFETTGKGQPYRYRGQFVCSGWHEDEGSDREGHWRKTIVFHLVPFEDLATPEPQSGDGPTGRGEVESSLPALRRRALAASTETGQEDVGRGRRNLYRRSNDVRAYVLARAAGMCEHCGDRAPFERDTGEPYLEPHHLRRLSDGGPDHPRWVAGVCPNCHREAHYGKRRSEINSALGIKIGEIEDALA